MRLIILTFITIALISCQADQTTRPNAAELTVRPASYEAQPGWEVFDDTNSGRKVYAGPQPLLTNGDIKRAVRAQDYSEQLAVRLTLTDDAGDRLLEYTRKHIREPLAILLDGELISAPTVMSGIRTDVVITGGRTGLTEEQADAITGLLRHRD